MLLCCRLCEAVFIVLLIHVTVKDEPIKLAWVGSHCVRIHSNLKHSRPDAFQEMEVCWSCVNYGLLQNSSKLSLFMEYWTAYSSEFHFFLIVSVAWEQWSPTQNWRAPSFEQQGQIRFYQLWCVCGRYYCRCVFQWSHFLIKNSENAVGFSI